MPTCYLILGTPRSGTSAVAGVLHRLGVVMGWELQSEDGSPRYDWPDSDEMNPTGYFQDCPIENAQFDIWGIEPPAVGVSLTPEQADPIRRLIQLRQSRGHSHWGIKASMTPWMVPEIINACKDDVRFIVTRRTKSESSQSLHAWMNGRSLTSCNDWISRSSDQIDLVLSAFPNAPTHTIQFADLLNRPVPTVANLARFVGLPATDHASQLIRSELWRVNHG